MHLEPYYDYEWAWLSDWLWVWVWLPLDWWLTVTESEWLTRLTVTSQWRGWVTVTHVTEWLSHWQWHFDFRFNFSKPRFSFKILLSFIQCLTHSLIAHWHSTDSHRIEVVSVKWVNWLLTEWKLNSLSKTITKSKRHTYIPWQMIDAVSWLIEWLEASLTKSEVFAEQCGGTKLVSK